MRRGGLIMAATVLAALVAAGPAAAQGPAPVACLDLATFEEVPATIVGTETQ